MLFYKRKDGGDMLNERIKQIRIGSGLTQIQFANRINLSRNYIALIESGDRAPSDRTISDICREFGVNEVWLRTGEGEPFQKQTREEQILRAAAQTVHGSNEFRKQVSFLLAQLDENDWAELEKIYRKLGEKMSGP